MAGMQEGVGLPGTTGEGVHPGGLTAQPPLGSRGGGGGWPQAELALRGPPGALLPLPLPCSASKPTSAPWAAAHGRWGFEGLTGLPGPRGHAPISRTAGGGRGAGGELGSGPESQSWPEAWASRLPLLLAQERSGPGEER